MRYVVVIQCNNQFDLCYSVEHSLVYYLSLYHASSNILKNQKQYENEKKLLKVKIILYMIDQPLVPNAL